MEFFPSSARALPLLSWSPRHLHWTSMTDFRWRLDVVAIGFYASICFNNTNLQYLHNHKAWQPMLQTFANLGLWDGNEQQNTTTKGCNKAVTRSCGAAPHTKIRGTWILEAINCSAFELHSWLQETPGLPTLSTIRTWAAPWEMFDRRKRAKNGELKIGAVCCSLGCLVIELRTDCYET